MWETERTSQIAAEVGRYNLAVFEISKTHWNKAEQQKLGIGEMPLYSGYEEEDAPYTLGVALMLSKET